MAGTKKTQATTLSVPLQEIKDNLKTEGAEEDVAITNYIRSAVEELEKATGRSFVSTTYTTKVDAFSYCNCHGGIHLDYPPVTSITSIKYVDENGTTQTLSSTKYVLDNANDFSSAVYPAWGEVWPNTRTQPNAVEIIYVAGYTTLPYDAVQVIKYFVTNYSETREGQIVGTIVSANPTVQALIAGLKCWEVV